MSAEPDEKLLQAYVKQLSVLRDPFENGSNLEGVFDFIDCRFSKWNYSRFVHNFLYEEQSFSNVAYTSVLNSSHPKMLIAAHADAVPGSPGADDNASGLAGLIEIARCIADTPASKHVQFVIFNLEEHGMIGSRYWVKDFCNSKNRPAGMLSLEMIGYTSQTKGSQKVPLFLKPFYPDTGNFIALVGDTKSKSLLNKAKNAFKRTNHLNVQTLTVPFRGSVFPEVRLSDHSPFWDAGVPALLVTDTSFFRYPFYHTPFDTPEKLDFPFMAKVAKGVIKLIEIFAKNPQKFV